MYVNKCTKCGKEFETKNPKRVICPECLYADRLSEPTQTGIEQDSQQSFYSSYSYDSKPENQERYQSYTAGNVYERSENRYQTRNSYGDRRPQQERYGNPDGGYSQNRSYGDRRPQQSRYGNPDGGYSQNRSYGDRRPQQGRYGNPDGGYSQNRSYGDRRPQQGRFRQNRFNPNNRMKSRPQRPQQQKTLLVNKEQLEQIEILYKQMLPLPNPDAHEVIGEKIGLEPRKVFFGINLIRQKMMLPKLPFPKRKLAISPDQMYAIQNLYEPLLPLPPIGCHKIIAAQLKMDEWRVHVGIGLIRGKLGLDRWNLDRPDAPEEFKKTAQATQEEEKATQEEAVKPKKRASRKKTETVEAEASADVEKKEDVEITDQKEDAEVVEKKTKKTTTKRATKKKSTEAE